MTIVRGACRGLSKLSRSYSVVATRSVPTLQDASLDTFRKEAFEPALPALLPQGSQLHLPAVSKWFRHGKGPAVRLNAKYLSTYASVPVPVEITREGRFARLHQTINFFLEWVHAYQTTRYPSDPSPSAYEMSEATIYIAQAPLADLPTKMKDDVPTPDLVLQAGKGDVYDSSIWLGQAPTYTPLHRDPNPNFFVQLAGRKVVRLFEPRLGNAIFSKVQEMIGGSASATMRGEEMMQGKEREVLEEEVWGEEQDKTGNAWQASLDAGDALFIPKGWWHSVKSEGEGTINGSVNWWFR